MDKLKKLLKEFSLRSDIMNAIVGIVLIVSLILIFQNPNNRYAILVACISGGLMNILSGLKQMKEPKRKTTGLTFIMLGVIVIFLGFVIMRLL